MCVALVLDGRETARPEVVPSHPRFDRLVEVVPERTPGNAKPNVYRLRVVHGIDPDDLHRRVAHAKDPVLRFEREPLAGRADELEEPTILPVHTVSWAPSD